MSLGATYGWGFLAQNPLSSCLPSKDIKVKIHKTIFLPVLLYGCEIMLLVVREECRHRAFEHRVARRIFGH